jgi:MFS family permease
MLRTGVRRFALPSGALPRPIVTIGCVMSLALLGDSLLYVALPAHAAELGLPLWTVGVLLGANRIVRLVTNGLAARLFARVGGRGPVVAAGVVAAITTAMYGLTPSFWPFLLARFAWGACFSTLRLGAFTVVLAASTATTRGRLVGVYQSISRIGSVGSLLIGSLLVESLGYHAAFVILGIVSIPAALLALSLPASAYPERGLTPDGCKHVCPSPTHRKREPRARFSDWQERWFGAPRLVAVKLGMLANGFTSQGVVLATLTLALADVAGTAEGAAAIGGLLVAFRWGSDLVLAPMFGHLSDRIGRGRMIPALLAIEAVTLAGLTLAHDRATVVVATIAVFVTSTAVTAASDAAAGDLAPPERRAQVMSGYSDWIDIGSAIGPPAAFMLAERVGLFPSYGCTAVLMLVVAGWFVVAWRRA